MLLGMFFRQRDHKLRIPLPPELSAELGKNIVVTQSNDRCLLLFPLWEFKKLNNPLLKESLNDEEVRSRRRKVMSTSFQLKIDKQRRITLPSSLAGYASLCRGGQQQVVILGMGPYLEIWNPVMLRRAKNKNTPLALSQAEEIAKKA